MAPNEEARSNRRLDSRKRKEWLVWGMIYCGRYSFDWLGKEGVLKEKRSKEGVDSFERD